MDIGEDNVTVLRRDTLSRQKLRRKQKEEEEERERNIVHWTAMSAATLPSAMKQIQEDLGVSVNCGNSNWTIIKSWNEMELSKEAADVISTLKRNAPTTMEKILLPIFRNKRKAVLRGEIKDEELLTCFGLMVLDGLTGSHGTFALTVEPSDHSETGLKMIGAGELVKGAGARKFNEFEEDKMGKNVIFGSAQNLLDAIEHHQINIRYCVAVFLMRPEQTTNDSHPLNQLCRHLELGMPSCRPWIAYYANQQVELSRELAITFVRPVIVTVAPPLPRSLDKIKVCTAICAGKDPKFAEITKWLASQKGRTVIFVGGGKDGEDNKVEKIGKRLSDCGHLSLIWEMESEQKFRENQTQFIRDKVAKILVCSMDYADDLPTDIFSSCVFYHLPKNIGILCRLMRNHADEALILIPRKSPEVLEKVGQLVATLPLGDSEKLKTQAADVPKRFAWLTKPFS